MNRDWPAVIRTVNVKLKADSEDPTALLRLAIALHGSGQEADARGAAERVLTFAHQKLLTAKSPHWIRFDLAIGLRLLNIFEDADRQLHDLLDKGGFPDPVLGPKDPGLDLFKADAEYQKLMADLNRQNEVKRTRILEIEKNFNS